MQAATLCTSQQRVAPGCVRLNCTKLGASNLARCTAPLCPATFCLAAAAVAPPAQGRQCLGAPAFSSSHRRSSSRKTKCRAAYDSQGPPLEQQQAQQQQAAGGPPGGGGWLARSDTAVVQAIRALLQGIQLVLKSLAALLPTARGALALTRELHYPSFSFVLRRTAQVLAVVAAFIAYVWTVDSLCSYIPRFIEWTHANPGWLRRAADSVVAAVAQRLTGAGA